MKEKEWKEKRANAKLGIRSILQEINQLLNLKVLNKTERNELNTVKIYLRTLLSYYNERSKVREEKTR